ncbi:dTMP kinase [Oscillatoriales cyanobacterium USR001]|nr:dTMP kinase [Oscillatoriales cyanobacterium USR001]
MGGKLIVFEGVEGGGKTTQIERSRLWLLSRFHSGNIPRIIVTREPGGTQLGKGLRRLLLESGGENICDRAELLLYAADRAQHVENLIKPELAKGSIILCDRFTDSTIAYQGYGRGLNLNLINQLNEIATGGLQSDLTLWLDIDVEVGLSRVKSRGIRDRIEQADLEFHRRVKQGFTELAAANRQRIFRVDANRNESEVTQEIQDILTQNLFVNC